MKKFGYVKFKVEGLNLDRLLKKLIKDLELFDIERQSPRVLSFSVQHHDKQKSLAIMNEKCYTVSIESELSAENIRQTLIRRAGLTLGLVLLCVLVWLYSSFVWSIDIEGNERLTSGEVASILTEAGIKEGTRKNDIDLDALELTLSLNPLVSAASVKINGTQLVISITEVLDYIDGEDANARRDIFSDVDGIVREILVLSGTSRVEVGDVVAAGDLLIEGVTLNKEGALIRECRAQGTVMVSGFKRAIKSFSLTETGFRRTGNTHSVWQISLFSKPFIKEASYEHPFKYFESETKSYNIFKGPLPFIKTVTTFYECERYEETFSLEQKTYETALLLTQMLTDQNQGAQVLGQTYSTREIGGIYILELYLELLFSFE